MIYHSLHSEFVYRTVGEALQNITPGLWVITSIEVKIKGFTCVSLPCNDQPLSHSLPILQSQCLFRNLWQREWPRFIIHQSSTQLGVFCKGAHRAKLYMECRFGGFGGSGDCGVGSRGGGRLQQRRRVGVLFGGVGTGWFRRRKRKPSTPPAPLRPQNGMVSKLTTHRAFFRC